MTKPLYFINHMNHDRKTHLQVKNQSFFVFHVLESKKELILSFLYAHPSLLWTTAFVGLPLMILCAFTCVVSVLGFFILAIGAFI